MTTNDIAKTLEMRGVSWDELVGSALQIILFGSWAVGANKVRSDIDLLCIGSGKRFKNHKVDIVWISPEAILGEKWLGSELAGHISQFGIWIYGNNNWSHLVKVSESAVAFKGATGISGV